MAAPDARTDNYSVTEDQLLVGSANGFLNNDSDPDGDPLSIILIDGLPFSFGTPITLASGAKLTINADGSFQYDQNGSFTYLSAGQTVNDIFTYTMSDGRFGFDTSAVCMTISGVTQSQPPTGVLQIEKDASVPGGTADVAGETINYTLAVTNQGNAAIANVVVDDPFTTNEAPVLSGTFNVGDTDQDNLLDVGETWQYTASHQVTQAELDAGTNIVNTATVTGTGATPDTDDALVAVGQSKILHLEKDALVPGGTADVAGETISYTLAVTNQGNAAIAGVVVDDPFTTNEAPVLSGGFNAGDTDQDNLLDVDETWQYTASHTVTQAELGTGTPIVNTATVTGTGATPDTDDALVAVGQSKILHLEKDALVPGGTADTVGETISYTLAVTNQGNAAIAGVVVTDPFTTNEAPVLVGGFNAGDADQDNLLDVAETWQYTASHTVTQAELDAGTAIVNTATVTGTGATPDDDGASVAVAQSKILNIVKDADVASVDSTSDTITYTYTVTNTGNAAIAGVVVTDDNLTPGTSGDDFNPILSGGDTDNDSLLDVNETWTYTATHTVTQAELDSGANLVNVAMVTGDGATQDDDGASVTVAQSPSLNIVKEAVTGQTADVAEETLNYTITVANTGNTTLTGVAVTDPNANAGSIVRGTDVVGDNDALLEVGETWGYTAAHTVTQAELDSNGGGDGDIDNIATADSDQTGPDTDDATVPVTQAPALNITKVAIDVGRAAPVVDAAGDVIHYTITVANTGNTTLTGVVVTDPNADAGSIVRGADVVGDNDALLEVGETWGYTAAHTVTQAEIDSNGGGDGDIDNTATVVSTETGPDTANASVPVAQTPALNITKVVNDVDGDTTAPVADAAGDVVTYTIRVANTGNQTLTGVTVTDTLDPTVTFVSGDTDTDGNLDVGETWTYSASYTVQQSDIDTNGGGDGDIDNTATVVSTETGPDTADASVPVAQTPALNITKVVNDVDGDTTAPVADAAGDVVTYTIRVANTGNQTLTGVTVTDTLDPTVTFVSGDTDTDGNLDVGETWTYSASYTVQQSDIDTNGGGDGDIDNTATVVSTETGPDTADASVPVEQTPALNITKVVNDVDGDTTAPVADAAGDVVTYTIRVANTGNQTLTGVTVTDTLDPTVTFVSGDTDTDGNLDVGETWTYSASYTVQQSDIDTNGGGDGDIDNTATVVSTETGPDTADASVPVEQTPALNVAKVVNDVDGDTTAPVADAAGDVVTYTIRVANTGNTTLTGVTVTDTLDPTVTFVSGDTDTDGNLDVGETWTYSASYTVQQSDIDTNGGGDGDIDNTATVVSTETGPDTADASVPMTPGPALNITKVVNDVDGDTTAPVADAAGDVVTYTIRVANTGNTTLTGVTVTDTLDPTVTFVSGDTDTDGNLDVGETWTYSASYTVQQSDIDTNGGGDGDIDNTATVVSTETGPDTADASVPVEQTPALNITKVVNDVDGDTTAPVADAAGDVVTYTISVANTGNQTLTGVTVTDTLDPTVTFVSGDTDTDGNLDVGETWTYSASYTVQQSDIDTNGGGDGDIDNTATVVSTETGPDTADASVPVEQTPALNITKVVNDVDGDTTAPVADAAGDVVTYTIRVANTGNQTLTGVTVTDTLDPTVTFVSGDTDTDGDLDVGETWTYSASYTVQQSDIDTNGGGDGDIDNTATVVSTETGPDTADASVPVEQTPALNITKVVNDVDGDTTAPVADAAGDVVTYTIRVANTGNQTLTGVTVTDTLDPTVTFVSGDTDTDGNLDVGETWTYSASYTVQQSDIDTNGGGDGDIDNTATVVSTETGPDTADASVPVEQTPALNITKVVNDVDGDTTAPVADAAGDVVTYTIRVANTGNTTLTGVTVTDTLDPTVTFVSGDTDTDGDLDVGETWTYSASYTVQQSDIDTNGGGDGDIDNTATVVSTETGPDTANASVPVTQTPPTGGDTTTLALDEEALGPGNPNTIGTNPASTAETAFDTLSFTAGSSSLTTFAFSTNLSGLVADTDGVAGDELVWVRDSATQITARFGSSGGPVAITLTLTPPPGGSIGDFTSGDVTVTATLSDNLKHVLDAGEQVLNLGSVGVIATATDGHFISDTVGVTVKDDVPIFIAPAPLVGTNQAGSTTTAALDSNGNIDDNVGADQLGTVRFPASLNNTISPTLTSGGAPIVYTVSSEGHLLTGTAGGSTVFTITLNLDGNLAGANDTYTVNMSRIVDTESSINFNGGTYNFTGGNTAWAGFVPNGQQTGGTPVPDGSDDLLLTPVGAGDTINGNANSAGVSGGGNGQQIGTGEGIRLDYVNDLTGDPAGSGGYNVPANRDFVFADHYEVNGAGVSFGGINIGSSAARFTAKDDPDGPTGNDAVGDGIVDPITSIAISFGGETKAVALAAFGPVLVGGHSFTIAAQGGGSVIVDGLVSNASIATYTASGFNSLEVAYASGNAFIITGFGTASVLAAPVNFPVPVELVDADGDAAAATLGVTLLPPPVSDVVDGGAGADTMYGLAGDDAYFVDNFADTVFENAGEGTDTVYSTAHFRLSDNVENLILQGAADLQGYGNGLSNTLYGNSGNNLLDGGAGADGMFGGAGNDAYFVDHFADAVFENANEGTDTVYSTAHFRLSENVENLILQGSADLQGYGNGLANAIFGSSGNDLLDGGAGADWMSGGQGNDAYFVDNPGDLVTEQPGEGADTVYASAHYRLGANVEHLVLQGSADLQGYGNEQSNAIFGSSGNDLLDGGAGADWMSGGQGNDAYFVDNPGDLVTEQPGEGADTVYASADYRLGANVEYLVLQGSADLQGYGNNQSNAISGNSGSNVINGGGGSDMLTGGAGNDAFIFEKGQAQGDFVMDFSPGDMLVFVGYGVAAVFHQLDSTRWEVQYDGGASHEVINFMNSPTIHPSDFYFII